MNQGNIAQEVRKREGILGKIGLFLFSLFVFLFLSEVVLRVFSPQQVIRMEGIWRPDPELGWRHVESRRCVVNTGERPVLWTTDENGFRTSPFPEAGNKNPDVSVLMLGDSFLEALAVDYEKTIPPRVEHRLEEKYGIQARVMNGGVGGWEPGQYLLEARRLLKQERFDLGVVFFYVENDFMAQHQFRFTPTDKTPSKEMRFPKEWKWEAFKRDVFYPINNFLEERLHLFVFFKSRFQILLARAGLTAYYFPDIFYRREAGSPKWDVAAEILGWIDQEFQNSNTPVLFVLLPVDHQVYPPLLEKYMKMFDISQDEVDLEQPNRQLAARLRSKSIPFLDMLPAFRQEAGKNLKLYGSVDNHLNAEGQRAVAEAIFPWMEDILTPKLARKDLGTDEEGLRGTKS